jgi:Domain of unknown function (DUF4918)
MKSNAKVQLHKSPSQASAILAFYKKLNPSFELGEGIQIMNPFQDEKAWDMAHQFYQKFYSDCRQRVFIFGINPGRFGGGITGVPFTDPIRLEQDCGIKNDFRKLAELSSIFVYEVINAYGGAEKFYGDFLISALSPLGFTKNGVNLNYYDDKQLLKNSESFIIDCIREQQRTIKAADFCFCLGEGTNYKLFKKLNDNLNFFEDITPLPHPRWVMQYRRKRINEFIKTYIDKLTLHHN